MDGEDGSNEGGGQMAVDLVNLVFLVQFEVGPACLV